MNAAPTPYFLQAVDALRSGQRRSSAALLRQELSEVRIAGEHWWRTSALAAEIGEIDIAIEAARRAVPPGTIDRVLRYCGTLANYGRVDEALAEAGKLQAAARNHSDVLHFRGMIAAERGDFEQAEALYREILANDPDDVQIWFLLATIKTFVPGDPDFSALEALESRTERSDPATRTRLFYALGKAWDDCGDTERAFSCFAKGAAIRRSLERYDQEAARRAAERIVSDFTPEAMGKLLPAGSREQRSLFVTGLPRSGTTLAQQILVAHSKVSDGAEVNLVRPAMWPTRDFTVSGALAYESRTSSKDPWGDVAADYRRFIEMRFRAPGLVVDKSLNQSALTGLLLHALPEARIVWLRRQPEDAAWSCFRSHFTSLPWSWSLSDIASHFRLEDQLFEHWRAIFPERILPLSYEALVQEPASSIAAMLAHFGLEHEHDLEGFHRSDVSVRTASVRQVRSPLSSARVGAAAPYARHMAEFRAAYRR